MIVKFPNPETLHLALTSGAIPPSVGAAGARVGIEGKERLWVESSSSFPRANLAELKRIGAQIGRGNGAARTTEVCCWAELLPLVRDDKPALRPEQTPILFELTDGQRLVELAHEMLRLGNDRQGYRWLEETAGGAARALLRVVGPPYYSLLRAIDRKHSDDPRAYVECAPGVWIELGYSHPLISAIHPPAGKILIISAPSRWTFFDDAPFQDIYGAVDFQLASSPLHWQDATLPTRLRIEPSLKPSGSVESAELWVLRDDPVAVLNQFVQHYKEEELHRLAFAVGRHNDSITIVLRARPYRLGPPAVDGLRADAYRTYAKLPNLYLPVGATLHPPLRRDRVRELFAAEPDQVTWLAPKANRRFVPNTLPETAFRPLSEWVDYVLDSERQHLEAWMQSTQFEFESFVCPEESPKQPRRTSAKRNRSDIAGRPDLDMARSEKGDLIESFGDPPEEVVNDLFAPDIRSVEPSELEKHVRALEQRFLAIEGGLDAPERQELWLPLADLYAQLNRPDEAGICLLNALWIATEAQPEWAWQLFVIEARVASRHHRDTGRQGIFWAAKMLQGGEARELAVKDLDRVLTLEEPALADLRALAAYLIWAAGRGAATASLAERLSPLHRFLEMHERAIPVRAAWLAWFHLVQLSGGDVLALARARDRILERLFHNGLRVDQDLPSFLRTAGQGEEVRAQVNAAWLLTLCDKARHWSLENDKEGIFQSPNRRTPAYIDLLFAFALARLGERDAAKTLLHRGRIALTKGDDEIHLALLEGFESRIKQALDGKASGGPLPASLLERLDKWDASKRSPIEKMRSNSRIFEPDQKLEQYRKFHTKENALDRGLGALPDLTDLSALAESATRLWQSIASDKEALKNKARVLKVVLGQLPRLGEEFSQKFMTHVVPVYDALLDQRADPDSQKLLLEILEQGLLVAAHYDMNQFLSPLVARFQKLLTQQVDHRSLESFDATTAACLRGLRRLGMRQEIELLLATMADRVLAGRSLAKLTGDDFINKLGDLFTLLRVASGWFHAGRGDQAELVLRIARGILYRFSADAKGPRTFNNNPAVDVSRLARVYVSALVLAPLETAQRGLEELFEKLKGVHDSYISHTWFGMLQLSVVEAVVSALVSDDFSLGSNARRWLDDDEYLVRQRIHRDLRSATTRT